MEASERALKRPRLGSMGISESSSDIGFEIDNEASCSYTPSIYPRQIHPSLYKTNVLGRRTMAMHLRRAILGEMIIKTKFKYLHEVSGHRSCVNAISFSRNSGQWMATGGDDMRIHVRDVFDYDSVQGTGEKLDQYRMQECLLGHISNIFSLSWSAKDRYLFSGGNDHQVLCYDLNYGDKPVYTVGSRVRRRTEDFCISSHEASIREVSTHPYDSNLLLSASDCGELFLDDMRLPNNKVAKSGFFSAQIASAQWNPNESDGRTFAVATVCDPKAGVALFDIRCMSSKQDTYIDMSNSLVKYASELSIKRPPHGQAVRRLEITGAQFDPSGRYLAADVSLYHPVLYAVGDAEPVATMSALRQYPHMNPCLQHSPSSSLDKYAGYRNSCTVKRGTFGFESQTGDLYYVTGSDDFRAYGWRIPPRNELTSNRIAMLPSDWSAHETQGTDRVWFRMDNGLESSRMILPSELDQPSFTLEGSRSIVNSAVCHPTLPMVATAGIERVVRLHYAVPASIEHTRDDYDSIRPKTRSRLRAVNMAAVIRAIRRDQHNDFASDSERSESQDEASLANLSPTQSRATYGPLSTQRPPDRDERDIVDEEAIALFDELLREEESRTLFRSDRYIDPSESEDSTDSESDNMEYDFE
ncbi:hypothetical protein MYAM1_001931 [Malassezia yamatoensis]|uniref:WD40 repeat-like protein n=1 Tax=Malassezia yamatoensis TaxID=253288 RepID=A0AAJ5YX25_9BASI|nr:hypothetical protein MYAM1_001931 [Malassezia yamatoensis]